MWQGMAQSALGLLVLLGFAWAISEDRRAVSARVVASAMVLQVVLALLLLRVPPVTVALSWLNKAVEAVRQATLAGTSFVFGYLGGGPAPFEATEPQNVFILATQGLPLILIVSALSALLFYWRILPKIVQGFAWLLERTIGLGGAVGVASSANVFVGRCAEDDNPTSVLEPICQCPAECAGRMGIVGTVHNDQRLTAQHLHPTGPTDRA